MQRVPRSQFLDHCERTTSTLRRHITFDELMSMSLSDDRGIYTAATSTGFRLSDEVKQPMDIHMDVQTWH